MPRAGWVLVLCLFHAAASGGEPDAGAVVRDFYARLTGGAADAAGELWTATARPTFERKYARIAAVRCMRIEVLDVKAGELSGEVASVDVVVNLAEWHAGAVRERLARRHSRFHLCSTTKTRTTEDWRLARSPR